MKVFRFTYSLFKSPFHEDLRLHLMHALDIFQKREISNLELDENLKFFCQKFKNLFQNLKIKSKIKIKDC